MASPSDLPEGINWEALARKETHPLRVSVLELLDIDGGRALSPKEMAYELHSPLPNVTYHAAELRKFGLIHLVHEHKVGGTIEHFYCLAGRAVGDLLERLQQHKSP
jgi:hypothetical protein